MTPAREEGQNPLKGRRPAGPTLPKARRQSCSDPRTSGLEARLRELFALTCIEAIVALALADGLSYAEIAGLFRISSHTVHTHVKAIHAKAGVSSNVRLLAMIHAEGWDRR